jgi:hypothetical protein
MKENNEFGVKVEAKTNHHVIARRYDEAIS